MLYLSDSDIHGIGLTYRSLVPAIEEAVRIADAGDYAQPVKPYLRYGNHRNRIIAMPAYLGGNVRAAGIKWIASFPDNIRSGLPRAHSVVVLNAPDTGKPYAVVNSPFPSIARTAAVSGLLVQHYMQVRAFDRGVQIGIIGWGPIGKQHAEMVVELFGDRIHTIRVFDVAGVDTRGVSMRCRDLLMAAAAWEDVYEHSDIVITCTVAPSRYIDRSPIRPSLLLHISLRDYETRALSGVTQIIVDDWEEICREDTDIERLHLDCGLDRSGVITLADVVCRSALTRMDDKSPILFCPMGMAIFDIAVTAALVRAAERSGIGTLLS